ncbi:aminotransferase class I/II-fold pyridoxal phosphate-dependent enzyme [bacterium]|nr:aminotransferase class I/II-fold pyridoxal phosphate-dependent enzyme [bacterium]QQR57813.1 MAG: aminotransferase class I/II-fold pyridoxal phosphate-dependent enzyme [Candidatus Melainabacteria bacterium]
MSVSPRLTVSKLPPYKRPKEGRYNFARLDFNENTTGFSDVFNCADLPEELFNTYPEYDEINAKIAAYYSVAKESVLLTNGSDEGISVISSSFIEAGEDRAIVSDPCFAIIPHSLRLAGAETRAVKVLADLSFNIDGIEAELKSGAKIAFFASPENPTGAVLEVSRVASWCKAYPETLIVIDEAYGEYNQDSCLSLINRFDNLLVLKTFSKAWGMAGLRLGIVFGKPELIEVLERVKLPYSVNAAAVWMAQKLLDNATRVKLEVKNSLIRLDNLATEIEHRGYKVTRGASNSILVEMGFLSKRFTEFCREQSVLIRDRSEVIDGMVRVSTGTQVENDKFLSVLDQFSKSFGIIFDLDDTIVDTSKSFAKVVENLVENYTGIPLEEGELSALKAEGGYNDDWIATQELINRRGYEADIEDIVLTAIPMYKEIAMDAETLMCDLGVLETLRKRHRIFIVTGRCRVEYDPVWGSRLDSVFDQVYCVGDRPHLHAKPSGDYLEACMRENNLSDAIYIGNSVDDVSAALSRRIEAFGVSTTLSAEQLTASGAARVLKSVDELKELLGL